MHFEEHVIPFTCVIRRAPSRLLLTVMSTAVTSHSAPLADGLDHGASCEELVDVSLLIKDAHAALFPFLLRLKGWSQVLLASKSRLSLAARAAGLSPPLRCFADQPLHLSRLLLQQVRRTFRRV